jgi:hypothetical protein
MTALERAGMHVGDAVEVITSWDKPLTQRQSPRHDG